jgi:hypothetical protein
MSADYRTRLTTLQNAMLFCPALMGRVAGRSSPPGLNRNSERIARSLLRG